MNVWQGYGRCPVIDEFNRYVHAIYPSPLQIKVSTYNTCSVSYLNTRFTFDLISVMTLIVILLIFHFWTAIFMFTQPMVCLSLLVKYARICYQDVLTVRQLFTSKILSVICKNRRKAFLKKSNGCHQRVSSSVSPVLFCLLAPLLSCPYSTHIFNVSFVIHLWYASDSRDKLIWV